MALPAPVDREHDILHSTTFPGPGWALPGLHPAQELRNQLDVPVEADNDANLAALAELVGGAAEGCSHFIYVKAAAGIGCGLVLDGKVYRGADGTAGELAHIIVEPHGDLCYCGSWGCLWTVVGAQAIEKTLSLARPSGDLLPRPPASQEHYEDLVRQVINEARHEDVLCQRALEDAARQLGRAVGNLCNILKPNLVVVGGTLSSAGDLFLAPMQESLDEYRSRLSRDVVPVVPGALGTRAELLGALALVFQSEADDVRDRLDSLLTASI
jgi:predicted NBD/HSP70 family sugar kinase